MAIGLGLLGWRWLAVAGQCNTRITSPAMHSEGMAISVGLVQHRLAALVLTPLLLLTPACAAPGTRATVVSVGVMETASGSTRARRPSRCGCCQATSAFGPLATRKLVHLMAC